MEKIKFVSARMLAPVRVEYTLDGVNNSIFVYVDYGRDQVYFPQNPELECDELRLAVLAYLDSSGFVEVPPLPPDVLEELRKISTGEYKKEIEKNTKFEGEQ